MRSRRSLNELSIEELEQILAIRKREARQERLRHYENQGRRLPMQEEAQPQQHEAAQHLPPPEPPMTYDITDDVPRFEDELEVIPEERSRSQPRPPTSMYMGSRLSGEKSARRQAWDRFLLAVEVLAVFGIVGVLAAGGRLIQLQNKKIDELEQKSALIQQEADAMRPAPSPAPILRVSLADYVLPGGHYSPNDTGGIGAFNLEELPESVRPLAMAQLSAPQAQLTAEQPLSPTRIEIPAIELTASIYGGDDWYALEKGVGHYLGSANPGEAGNIVLSGHNDIYGEAFRYIEKLEPGNEIYIEANNGQRYTYVVTQKQVVRPTDTWVLDRGNKAMVTLITCHPYRVDNMRMVVFAELREPMS